MGTHGDEQLDPADDQNEATEPQSSPREQDRSELVSDLRKNMGAKLANDEYKPSVGDYLKLLQMEKELEDEETKEIRVTWVEPDKSNSET